MFGIELTLLPFDSTTNEAPALGGAKQSSASESHQDRSYAVAQLEIVSEATQRLPPQLTARCPETGRGTRSRYRRTNRISALEAKGYLNYTLYTATGHWTYNGGRELGVTNPEVQLRLFLNPWPRLRSTCCHFGRKRTRQPIPRNCGRRRRISLRS